MAVTLWPSRCQSSFRSPSAPRQEWSVLRGTWRVRIDVAAGSVGKGSRGAGPPPDLWQFMARPRGSPHVGAPPDSASNGQFTPSVASDNRRQEVCVAQLDRESRAAQRRLAGRSVLRNCTYLPGLFERDELQLTIGNIRRVSPLNGMSVIRPAPLATARMSAPSRADCDRRPTVCQTRRPRAACGRAPQAHLRPTDVQTVARSRTRVEHRGLVAPTSRAGNAREPRRRTGGTRRGRLGRQAEMPEDAIDHGRLLDERDQTQAAATPRTRQNVDPKRSGHEGR